MKRWDCYVVLLAVCLVRACSGFEWESKSALPDNSAVPVCVGEDVDFNWNYNNTDEEVVLNVEWHYQPQNGADEMLATEVGGHMFLDPIASKDILYLPNAGIRVFNVSAKDSGRYSVHVNINLHGSIKLEQQAVNLVVASDPYVNGQLEAKFNGAQAVGPTGEEHIVLSCGKIDPLWARSLNVKWTTPSNETLNSTYDGQGNFLLTVPNPVQEGQYTCFIDDIASAHLCVNTDNPARSNADVSINALDARLLLMESKISELRNEQAMKDQLISNLTQQVMDLSGQLATGQTGGQGSTGVNSNLTQTLSELQTLKNDVETLKTSNAQLTQQVGDIQTLRNDVQAVKDANENLTRAVGEIGALRTEVQSLTAENANLMQQCGRCQSLEAELRVVDNETVALASQLQTAAQSVSFQALSDDRTYNPGDRVVFPTLKNNDGHAYDNSTGVFTAPLAGTYAFHVSVQIKVNSPSLKDVWADLAVNDQPVIQIPTSYVDGMHVQGSGQAVVQLHAGDTVSVSNQYNNARFDKGSTSFSGALIHASMV